MIAGRTWGRRTAALILAGLANLLILAGLPFLTMDTTSLKALKPQSSEPIYLTRPRLPEPPPETVPLIRKPEPTPPPRPERPRLPRPLPPAAARPRLKMEAPRLDFQIEPQMALGLAVPAPPPRPAARPAPALAMAPAGPAGAVRPSLNREFELGEVDQAPAPVSQSPPLYPWLARRKGLTGQVVVRFLVDREGQVRHLKVLEASPEGVFEESVRAAVSRWRFRPGVFQGRPVPTWVVLPIKFELTG